MECFGKETVFTCGVKCSRGKVKEFGIPEIWGKNGIYLDDRTYAGMAFVGRRGWNEVGICLGVFWMKLKVVAWKILKRLYDVRWVHFLSYEFFPSTVTVV